MTGDATAFVFCRGRRRYQQKKYYEKKDRPYDDFCLHKSSLGGCLIFFYDTGIKSNVNGFLNWETIENYAFLMLDISLSLAVMSTRASITKSISSSVVSFPRENRIAPWAVRAGIPIARRTWEGSGESVLHAEPEEA